MQIGTHQIHPPLILAPMAGVTDRPFRQLCRKLGAGLTVSEMVSANMKLWKSRKTQLRLNHQGEDAPRIVQIVGAMPSQMAEAAQFNVTHGAQIIDINMGCPAKKVCNTMAGSALLKDEKLVAEILTAVVNAVTVPVTLKIRTGWDKQHNNATNIARIAEDAGIQAISVHGRSRACAFKGEAEYETVAAVKSVVNIPVIANGDIDHPLRAKQVLTQTGVDGLMIGRGAQGNPWIFKQIQYFLEHNEYAPPPDINEFISIIITHLYSLYDFYGMEHGVRIARKHIGWYCKQDKKHRSFCQRFNQVEHAMTQIEMVSDYFAKTEQYAA